MHRFKKMKFVSLLVALMMALSLIPLVAPQVASAAPSFSSLNSLSSMYASLAQDTAGLGNVTSAQTALEGLTPTTSTGVLGPTLEDQIFGSGGLLSLPATVNAADATQFLIDLEKIKYSSSLSDAIDNTGTFYTNDAGTEGKLLPGVSVGDFITFAMNVQTTGLEKSLSSVTNYNTVMNTTPLSPSFIYSTVLPSAMTTAAAGTNIATAVNANGWSFTSIASAEQAIDSLADSSFLGETALFKAYVNSNITMLSSSTTENITVPAAGGGSLDLNGLTGGDQGPLPSITVTGPTSTVTIQQGTTITASGGTWDGTISLPTVVTPPASELPANINASSVVAISIGPDNNVTLTFSIPVSILVPGQTGKSVGYIKNGAFTQITNKLTSNALPSGAVDGYYDDGVNITIWTTHFTTFLTYTASAVSGGGGGGGGHPAAYTPTVQTSAATSVTADSVVLNGDITSDNGYSVTDYGFLWGTSSSSLTNKLDVGTSNISGAFTDTLSGLTAGTIYYFEAYATNSSGTADGAVMSFTAGAPPPVPAQVFSDVPTSYWAADAINGLSSLGYVSGYPDGTFMPDNRITRAEFVSILSRTLKLAASSAAPGFSDVSSGDWFYGSVESAVYAGIVKGYGDGTFQPNAPISRQEIACVLVQAMGKADVAQTMMNAQTIFTDDTSIAAWARGFIGEANQAGLIKGYPNGSFAPENDATRAEACVMINNLLVLQSKS
jgi:hypothetical protein